MFWNSFDIHSIIFIFEILYVATLIFTLVLVIQQKGEPLKTISWLLVVLFFPFVGILFYFFFGKNYRKQKIFSRKGLRDLDQISELNIHKIHNLETKRSLKNPAIKSKVHIMRLLQNNSKSLLTEYNNLKIYNNGKETFEDIFAEIEKARDHIHLEYYIIEDDKLGKKFKDILIKKSLQGIEVRLIYDDLGSWDLSSKFLDELENAGIKHFAFLPVRFHRLTNKINYRNHRKIIVIDGKIGFVGGMNVADRYIEGNDEIGMWRDTHLKIEGEAVHSLQLLFLTDWFFVSKKIIQDSKYFPATQIEDHRLVMITASGPDSDWASIMQAYFSAITTATKHIYISTPYFIPNESILTALKTAALSGIDVKILLPRNSDSRIVYRSTLSFVGELLEAGIHIHFYERGFNHSKIIMVDSIISSIGSANIDIRSFDQNFEVNALIFNEEKTRELEEYFLDDLKYSKTYSIEEWDNRPWTNNVKESFARLLSPLF